jgi:hypothetical protein
VIRAPEVSVCKRALAILEADLAALAASFPRDGFGARTGYYVNHAANAHVARWLATRTPDHRLS